MSVLIKGMEMPKNCAVCRLERDLFGRAICFGFEDGRALYKDDLPPVGNEERRPEWCPLTPVPPHGRLIDADALKAKAIERSEKCGVCVNVLDNVITAYDIETAPTIIPAESITAEEEKNDK